MTKKASPLPLFLTEPNPDVYLNGTYLVLDFETTNREHGSALDALNSLLLACWRKGGVVEQPHAACSVHLWSDEYGMQRLLEDIASVDFIVAHNAKFELQWLRRCGLDLRKIVVYDTWLGEYVLDGNRIRQRSLGAVAKAYGYGGKASFVSASIGAGICPSLLSRSRLREYCERDIELTERVFLRQRSTLKDKGLLPTLYSRCLVTPVLADIEFAGLGLDRQAVAVTHAEYKIRYDAVLAEFEALTGGANPRSNPQMRELLYVKYGFAPLVDSRGNNVTTKGGALGTDNPTLLRLKATTPEQAEFLKVVRKLAKLKVPVQNLAKMQKVIAATPKDEIPTVYATFNQGVARNHRLSSSGRRGGFQFQNFDRAFKPLFRARRDGWQMCEGDGTQVEFRVATYLGNDGQAKADIHGGVDVHALSAATMGVSRQAAKSETFKPLYGGRSGTPRQRAYYAEFQRRYPDIYRTQTAWTMRVANDKRLVTETGLVFYWPNTEVSKSGYVTNTPSIFNYPVSALTGADIIPLTLCLVWHSMEGFEGFITNTIHDSIVAEIPDHEVEEYTRITVDCFTNRIYDVLRTLYGITFDVPLGCSTKHGTHWAVGEESKHDPRCSGNAQETRLVPASDGVLADATGGKG